MWVLFWHILHNLIQCNAKRQSVAFSKLRCICEAVQNKLILPVGYCVQCRAAAWILRCDPLSSCGDIYGNISQFVGQIKKERPTCFLQVERSHILLCARRFVQYSVLHRHFMTSLSLNSKNGRWRFSPSPPVRVDY